MAKILLIDGANNFLRNYTVIPTLDIEGRPNGGAFGFLRSLYYFINTIKPDKVVIVWDGPGGSKKRKAINKNYKSGRKPARLNRNFEFELEDQEKNKLYQRIRLAEYLKDLPVSEITIPDIEADDVIAYLVQYFQEEEKVIVSTDKDFYQLIGTKVKAFSPTKKEFINEDVVFNQFGVHTKNFAIARSIIGDPSDNLRGVPGVGFKRLVKQLPLVTEDRVVDFDEVFEFCKNEGKKHTKYLESKQVILDNYKIMQLSTPIISVSSSRKIREILNKKTTFNATSVRIKLLKDGITSFTSSFFQSFRVLNAKGKTYDNS